MSFNIKFKRGTASEWNNSAYPSGVVLSLGEPGYEKDTGKLKIGNGSTPWALLPYVGADDEIIRDLVGGFVQQGSGVSIVHDDNANTLTINVSGLDSSYIGDFNEAVDDRVGSGLFVAGTGIFLSYNDISNSFIVSTTGVSLIGHSHTSSNITDFTASVSGLLPVKDLVGSGYVSVSNVAGTYTIGVTGLQPSGNYSIVGHTHTTSDITNFNSGVSGLLPTVANSGDNRILTSTGSINGINGESNLTFNGNLLNVNGSGSFGSGISGSILNIDNIRIDGNSIFATNSNGSLHIVPTGTGSLQADIAGNIRGQYSIDLQRSRNDMNQVTEGNYSVMCGGSNNRIQSNYSFIGAGYNNQTLSNSHYSVVVGGESNFVGPQSVVVGGYANIANGQYATIVGGQSNYSSTNYTSVLGGLNNQVYGDYGFIGGGKANQISSYSPYSSIIGGSGNYISSYSDYCTILGGLDNYITTYASGVTIGGISGVASLHCEQTYSAGSFNTAGDAQTRKFILRGRDNTSSTVNLKLDGNTSGSQYLYVPPWTSWYFTIKVIGRRNGAWGSSSTSNFESETAAYRFEGVIENRSNNGFSNCVILPDANSIKTVIHEDDAGWDCNISIQQISNDPYLNITCSV
jgi:hypothetical protein